MEVLIFLCDNVDPISIDGRGHDRPWFVLVVSTIIYGKKIGQMYWNNKHCTPGLHKIQLFVSSDIDSDLLIPIR